MRAPTGGKLPTGGSVTPKAGPTWLVVGDAAGSINPFNGEGIGYAYETGRLAAEALDNALATGDGLALARYPERSTRSTASTSRSPACSSSAIGNPAVMRELTRVGMHSRTLMEWVLRIMANLLRPDEIGPAEAAYEVLERLVAVAPDPSPTGWPRRRASIAVTACRRAENLGPTGHSGSLGATRPAEQERGERAVATTCRSSR